MNGQGLWRRSLVSEKIMAGELISADHGKGFSEAEGKQVKKKKKTKKERVKGKKGPQLLPYEALPDYLKDNEFILDHYRADYSLKQAFHSFFCWHNETLNVWTHFLGFVLFLALTIANSTEVPEIADILWNFSRSFSPVDITNVSYTLNNTLQSTIRLDLAKATTDLHSEGLPVTRWPLFVFLGGSMFCLLSSSLCHLFGCHSHQLSLFLWRFDYAGIAIMIVASFFPPIYYIFQCEPQWQLIYLAGITTFGVFTVLTLLTPAFSSPEFRSFRAMLFVAMGFSGLIPAVHALVVNWSEPRCLTVLAYELAMAALYSTGTFFYVSRIPEKWLPGKFDLAGHSHQIFHVFVVGGALAHYGATLVFLDWRGSVGCQ
ncbi:heptahelical transmembrane protein 1 [Nymphaea colorata]|uniref:heptahelical transmembrane protein 1 n=1 Tax=Nymphaea colorata TaxID=210225 RepID=UPI00129DEA0E|nr:heptahelical transmembrane protein 1 [Nymphaea colorata]